MHSLLIHQVFVGPDEVGGSRHYELGCLLAEKGQRFTIVTSTRDYITDRPRRKGLDVPAGVPEGAMRVVHAWTPGIVHRSFILRVVAFMIFMMTSIWRALGAGRVDLVMGTSPPIFQCVSAWFVAAVRRRPFLLEVRDLWPEFAIDMGVLINPFLIRASRWLEGFLYRHADHILVNSPAYRDYLLSKGVHQDKISVVPNGVDPSQFDPDSRGADFRRQAGVAPDQVLVTYCGALGMANDIYTILRAAARLKVSAPDLRLMLVGDGKERPNIEALARRDALDNLMILGSVKKRQVPEVLAASNICVATLMNIKMFRTTYPNKVFDYMAAGRPVVLAIDGVIREVVDSAQAGIFVPPGDDAALEQAILRLARDPAMADEMGGRGRSYVLEHFDRREQSAEFARVLMSVAGEKDNPGPTEGAAS